MILYQKKSTVPGTFNPTYNGRERSFLILSEVTTCRILLLAS